MGNSSSSGNTSSSGLIEAGTIYVDRYPFCKFSSYVRLLFGLLTALAVFYAAVFSLSSNEVAIGIYLVFIGILILLLELGKIIRMCCGTNGAFCQFFKIILGFDNWLRALLYWFMASVCFLSDVHNWQAKVVGSLLVITGILYFVKTFQKKKIKTYAVSASTNSGVDASP